MSNPRFLRPNYPGARGRLGDYGASDPNTHPQGYGYNEREVFNPTPGDLNAPGISRRMAQYGFYGQAAPARALIANPNRCYLMIQNTDAANNLYLGFGAGADAATGFIILPNGGTFLADYNVPTDDVYLYFATGAASLAIIGEGVFAAG